MAYRLALAAAVAAATLVPLIAAAPAASARSCSESLILDWANDGKVGGTYPVACYREALRTMPLDLESYTTAYDDIYRRLTNVLRTLRTTQAVQTGDQSAGESRIAQLGWSALVLACSLAVGAFAVPVARRAAARKRRSD